MRIVRLGVSGRRGSGAPAVARVNFDAQRLGFRGVYSSASNPPFVSSAAALRIRFHLEGAVARGTSAPSYLAFAARAAQFFVCPSDRDVSKLKQVAPVVAGQQQSVGAVALRATAEQD